MKTQTKITVLVVDDEAEVRGSIRDSLDELDVNVIEANDGLEALQILRTTPCDVVVSDVSMPKMNGISLLEHARQEKFFNPFIILTAFGSKEYALKALRLGAFDFIEKPFRLDNLLKVVGEAIKVRVSTQEMEDLLSKKSFNNANPSIKDQEALSAIARMKAKRSA